MFVFINFNINFSKMERKEQELQTVLIYQAASQLLGHFDKSGKLL